MIIIVVMIVIATAVITELLLSFSCDHHSNE